MSVRRLSVDETTYERVDESSPTNENFLKVILIIDPSNREGGRLWCHENIDTQLDQNKYK